MKLVIPIVENEIPRVDTPYGRSLYEIERKTILQIVCEQYMKIKGAEFVFVLHKHDIDKFRLDSVIKLIVPNAAIVVTEGKTAGAACSCLLAFDYFVGDEPVIIAGSDQFVDCDLQSVAEHFINQQYDGGVITFQDVHPRWSYVRLNADNLVVEAREKTPISNHATTGFYYFKRTADFTDSVFSMIKKKATVDGKYYVCPAFNEMILRQKKIGVYTIEKNKYFNFSHQKGIEMYEKYLHGEATVNAN